MRTLIFLLLALLPAATRAQSLDDYVRRGLQQNELLQQKNIGLERAMLALKSARNMFLPSVSLQGAYQTGEGGRSIAFPLGDLLNPVYSTLNQLTASDAFPQVDNVRQSFFPNDFYDLKLRATLPVLQPDLIYQKRIRSQEAVLQQFEADSYARELVKEIKVAWYNYQQTSRAAAIYSNALDLAREGRRVNESLLANGKGLPASVLRSVAEEESVKAMLSDAQRQKESARLYLNFLINASPSEPVPDDSAGIDIPTAIIAAADSVTNERREELKALREAVELRETVRSMNASFRIPRISAFADAGYQGERRVWDGNSDYYFLGVQLEVPLFAGFTNSHRVKQSGLDIRIAELEESRMRRSLSTGLSVVKEQLRSDLAAFSAAKRQLEAAQSYHRLTDKAYREGTVSFIEMLDARNQLRDASLRLNINSYRVMTTLAQLEREIAGYSLHP
jgi:outer membrane protein TolC